MGAYSVYLQKILSFLTEYWKKYLWKKVHVALLKSLETFKNALWNEVKDSVREQAKVALETAKAYYSQEQVKVKKEQLISQIVDKVELPLLLKPFKKLIKHYISTKVEKVILDSLQKGCDFLS